MDKNTLSFQGHLDKKDLQAFTQSLFQQVIDLQVKNQELIEKVLHLEELLKHDATIIKPVNINE
jgi:hypothetical protein